MSSCPFCSFNANRKWIENEHAIAFADLFPVADGHTLVTPRRHVASIYELSADEQSAVWELVAQVCERLVVGLNQLQERRLAHRSQPKRNDLIFIEQ
jgi:diadenosine tetraphosphate (Ap4A) HIT family hydrolase